MPDQPVAPQPQTPQRLPMSAFEQHVRNVRSGVEQPAKDARTLPIHKGRQQAQQGQPEPAPAPTAEESAEPDQEGSETMLGEPEQEQGEEQALEEPVEDAESLDREVHGMPLRDIVTALEAGELPATMLDKLQIEVTTNGQKLRVPISEAAKGYSRTSDYGRAKTQLQQQQAEMDATRAQLESTFASWQDGNKLRASLRRMGLGQALHDAVVALGQEILVEREMESKLSPQEFATWKRLRVDAERAADLESELEQVRGKTQKQSQERQTDAVVAQLQQMVPMAFQQYGIKENPTAQRLMGDHLKALWPPGVALSHDIVLEAAKATREDLDDLARAHVSAETSAQKAARQRSKNGQFMPAVPASTSPTQGGQRGTNGKRMGLADFDAWVKSRR